MSDDAEDKQHLATGKHLADLRKRGIVLRSRDLSGGLIFITGVLLIIMTADKLKLIIQDNFIQAFNHFDLLVQDSEYVIKICKQLLFHSFESLLPILIILFVVGLLSPFLLGGWNFTLDVLQFNLGKIDPLNNLKRLLSPKQGLIEIAKSIIKAFTLLSALIIFIIFQKNQIVSLTDESIFSAVFHVWVMVKYYIGYLSLALIITVAFDVIYHFFHYQKESKMSTQQIKDEHKNTEGNVETKRKIRSKQIILIQQRLNVLVPKASVVIANPEHFAVALKYDKDKDKAPRVLIKGQDNVAMQIKKIAALNAVTIYEAPQLARALYYTTKMGHEIHPGLYKAVAIILSYVYQLQQYQSGLVDLPQITENLEIPNEFKHF